MARWQTILTAVIAVDVELGEAVHALKLLETIERHLTSTGNELKQLGLLFLLERSDSAPEPLDLWRCSCVVVVLGVVLPVIHIDVRQTGNEKFELLFAEDGDELRRDDIVEALEEVLELLLNGAYKTVLSDKADVLVLVIFGDGNVTTVFDEVDGLHLSKGFDFN